MLKDLLDFEGLRGAGLSVEAAPHPLAPLFEEALEMIQPQAREKSIQLTSHAPAGATAWFDRERTLQVLSNLLGNAVKLTPDGGEITAAAELVSSEVVVTVRDTGPGIPPDDVPHVFDRYWQAKRADRRGTGLGLPIAKGLVEAQGGKLLGRERARARDDLLLHAASARSPATVGALTRSAQRKVICAR